MMYICDNNVIQQNGVVIVIILLHKIRDNQTQ